MVDYAACYGGLENFWPLDADGEYALHDLHALSRERIAALRRCASDVARVYDKLPPLLRGLDGDALGALGLPEATHEIARLATYETTALVLARVDMIFDGERARMIECNADTPAFIVETHAANGAVCAAANEADPNAGCALQLRATLQRTVGEALPWLVRRWERQPRIVFSASAHSREDLGTAAYLAGLVRNSGIGFVDVVPLDELRLRHDRLTDPDGRTIDVLYRLWPMEHFASDRDASSGAALGPGLFSLVRRRRLALINPPSGYLLQSKAVQAIVWGLYEAGVYFDERERDGIARSFLPTAWDDSVGYPLVRKPALGREGAGISIARSARESREAYGPHAVVHPMTIVSQRYVEPSAVVVRRGGERRAQRAVYSCFLLHGAPGAIGVRVNDAVVDHTAAFVPIAVASERTAHDADAVAAR